MQQRVCGTLLLRTAPKRADGKTHKRNRYIKSIVSGDEPGVICIGCAELELELKKNSN
jgi:hypothetical protein